MNSRLVGKDLVGCRTKWGPSALKIVSLLALFLSAACGSFHTKELSSAEPLQAVTGTDDGIVHAFTPSPTPIATPAPVAATPTPVPTPPATLRPVLRADFRVMTFNIKGIPCLRDSTAAIVGIFGVKRCPAVSDVWTKHVPERVAELLTKIQDLRNAGREPDVIFLQEAFTAKNDIFDDDAVLSIPARSGYPYFAFGALAKVSNGLDDYWNLINQDQKKLRSLFSSGLLVLSKHPIRAQASLEYGDVCAIDDCNSNKSVMMVGLRHASLGLDMDVFNTHMQAGAGQDSVRSIQADLLTSFVQAHSSAQVKIMGGDYNVRLQYNSEQVAKITTRLGVKDAGELCARAAGSPSGACAVAGGTDPGRLGGDILDHVFVGATSPIKILVTRGEIPSWTYGGFPLSDHDPVLLDFRVDHPL